MTAGAGIPTGRCRPGTWPLMRSLNGWCPHSPGVPGRLPLVDGDRLGCLAPSTAVIEASQCHGAWPTDGTAASLCKQFWSKTTHPCRRSH